MTELRLKNSTEVKNRVVARVMGRLKLADFLNLTEDEFRGFIKEVEREPLFKKLTYPDETERKVISYKRFPSSASSLKFSEFREESTPGSSIPDIEKMLEGKSEIISRIRSVGPEKFKKHFIYNESCLGIKEIGEECGLGVKETRQIMSLVNKVFIAEEYYFNPPVNPAKVIRHWRVADIEKEKGGLIIKCRCLSFARGRYTIDYKKLLVLRDKGIYGKKEIRKINSLISKLELINTRKTMFYRVLRILLEKHRTFFMTGEEDDLSSFTQKQAARILGITPGVLSRTVSRKSIGMPWGEERPLRDFFPSRKKKNKEIVRRIIEESAPGNEKSSLLTDFTIRDELNRKYGIILSRRSVCQYRNELLRYVE